MTSSLHETALTIKGKKPGCTDWKEKGKKTRGWPPNAEEALEREEEEEDQEDEIGDQCEDDRQ